MPINPRLTCAARNPCPHGAVAVSLACPSWRSGPGVPQKPTLKPGPSLRHRSFRSICCCAAHNAGPVAVTPACVTTECNALTSPACLGASASAAPHPLLPRKRAGRVRGQTRAAAIAHGTDWTERYPWIAAAALKNHQKHFCSGLSACCTASTFSRATHFQKHRYEITSPHMNSRCAGTRLMSSHCFSVL